jgi:hypothetical protein
LAGVGARWLRGRDGTKGKWRRAPLGRRAAVHRLRASKRSLASQPGRASLLLGVFTSKLLFPLDAPYLSRLVVLRAMPFTLTREHLETVLSAARDGDILALLDHLECEVEWRLIRGGSCDKPARASVGVWVSPPGWDC